jgi:preprotein translocase subunit SecG
MQAVLRVIHLLVTIGLIFAVLLQRSEGGALGMGGGGSGLGGLFSPRGAASTLTRTTVGLGIAFFALSMALTMMTLGTRQSTGSVLAPATQQSAPGAPGGPPGLPSRGPAAPPAAPGTTPPAAPAAPQLPAVPPTR